MSKKMSASSKWNLILIALAVLVCFDAVTVLTRDFQHANLKEQLLAEAGMLRRETSSGSLEWTTSTTRDHSTTSNKEGAEESQGEDENVHKIAGLNCDRYGGPSKQAASEMVYWQDIPSDSKYVSPLKDPNAEPKYLTFEPDEGGWNNIRMSMETAFVLAHATGRILVLPPEQGMYLLQNNAGKQKNKFSFADFFHFDSVATEHMGVDIITFQDFLRREVKPGHLTKPNGKVVKLPMGKTNFDGISRRDAKMVDQWLRSFTSHPIWSFDKCMVGIPSSTKEESIDNLREVANKVLSVPHAQRHQIYFGNPVAVNAGPEERLREAIAHRKNLCLYNKQLQNAKVLHMMGDNASGARLLVHFYAFLFFEDWKSDLWTKRFVRDHLRYVDEIQCAAARVVHAMRQKAKQHGDPSGTFDTFHIRRGDFQYKETRIEPQQIVENIRDVVPFNTTIFIATDERDKSFFKIFKKYYNAYFLDDFRQEVGNINTNFYGMLDQRIASRGRTFVGCYFSTFTGYINRMRGYHSQKDKAPGWQNGAINSYYYVPKRNKLAVREYRPISPPMWGREFPLGWRDLNHGITEIHDEYSKSV